MFRLKLVVAVLGGMLAFFGYQEWRVSQGTTPEPIDVVLADVEAGNAPPNSHWKLGEHVAIYNAGVYQYKQSKYATGEPGPDAKVDYYYYPVLSSGHPFLVKLGELAEQNGGVANIPDDQIPAMNDFAVLVKTKKFGTIGSIPDEWAAEGNLQGLVINQITSLDNKEEELLRQGFPGLNTEKLLLLEADRHPAPIAKSGGMILGGSVLALGAVGWMFAGRKSA
jgi:hypothetical protein